MQAANTGRKRWSHWMVGISGLALIAIKIIASIRKQCQTPEAAEDLPTVIVSPRTLCKKEHILCL